MSSLAFLLVLVSAVLHPTWNFLLKKSPQPFACLWAAVFVVTGALLPVVLLLWDLSAYSLRTWLVLAAVSAFNGTYFWLLARTYERGDLSRVYPFTRGTAPALVLLGDVLLLGERPTAVGIAAVLLIVLGVYVLHLRSFAAHELVAAFRALGEPVSRLAFLNALCVVGYSLVNKVALNDGVPPLVLYVLTNLAGTLALLPFTVRSLRRDLPTVWQTEPLRAVVIGLLQTAAYVMVLWAMMGAPVGYVEAVRQIGIVFGTAAGVLLLREPFAAARLSGALLIITGVVGVRLFG